MYFCSSSLYIVCRYCSILSSAFDIFKLLVNNVDNKLKLSSNLLACQMYWVNIKQERIVVEVQIFPFAVLVHHIDDPI